MLMENSPLREEGATMKEKGQNITITLKKSDKLRMKMLKYNERIAKNLTSIENGHII